MNYICLHVRKNVLIVPTHFPINHSNRGADCHACAKIVIVISLLRNIPRISTGRNIMRYFSHFTDFCFMRLVRPFDYVACHMMILPLRYITIMKAIQTFVSLLRLSLLHLMMIRLTNIALRRETSTHKWKQGLEISRHRNYLYRHRNSLYTDSMVEH